MERWIRVAAVSDLQSEGFGVLVDADGLDVALFRWGDRVYAVENLCPHMGFSLADSLMQDGEVICGWHGWHIDLKTGACRREKICARVFPCEIREDGIWLQIETLSTE